MGISSDTRDGHEMLMLLLQPPGSLCASTGHYPPHSPHPLGACAACHCQGPVIQGQLPWENTLYTSVCYNITPASAAAGLPYIPIITTVPLPPPDLNEQDPIIGRCFNPVLSGWEQMPEGSLHTEVGPKPKLNPRSCANKDKGKFLLSASGAAD